MIAYCYASGLIEFGAKLPDGALPIAHGPAKALREFIEAKARHGYKSEKIYGRLTKIAGTDCLLVPGVPEAPNQTDAVDSLMAWQRWIKPHAPKTVRVSA